MGAAGGAIIGILLFNEPVTVARVTCIGLIISGIVGLKLLS
jgi:quaternary ammonium compound-resistance protein SugE